MATIQQEIMSIAEAQGYEGKSSGTIAEAVNALGSVMGDYELPAATATTLGGIKVGDGLAVESDGTLSASGGGAEPLIVHITGSTGSYVADKTFAEIGEAVAAKRPVYAINGSGFFHDIVGEVFWHQLTHFYNISGEGEWATFTSLNVTASGTLRASVITCYPSGSINVTSKTITVS